jgi:hypothetical protein
MEDMKKKRKTSGGGGEKKKLKFAHRLSRRRMGPLVQGPLPVVEAVACLRVCQIFYFAQHTKIYQMSFLATTYQNGGKYTK